MDLKKWTPMRLRKVVRPVGLYCTVRIRAVVKVQHLRWGNGTFRFGPPLPGYVHFSRIVTVRGGGTL